jgi:hypothetical protein
MYLLDKLDVGYGGGPGPAYQMPTNQHQQGGAGPGVRHSVPTESAIGTSSVGETPVQMQPFRAPGPNAPLLRQTTPLVNFANVVPPSQQLAGSQATGVAPLVKRERKPLIIFNPETEKPVEIPAPIVAERRPSVVEGAAKAPPVSADTSTNSTVRLVRLYNFVAVGYLGYFIRNQDFSSTNCILSWKWNFIC